MQPLVFAPYLRPQIWGGRALSTHFGKALPESRPYGESWELSGHAHHVSVVAEGPLAGLPLDRLVRERRGELLGGAAAPGGRFPLLVKLLDCAALLSVQVHPDDETAAALLGDERGKTEAWVILAAGPQGRIYAGLKHGTTPQEVAARMADGTVAECLHSFAPRVGDCVFLPAGLVHAVGGGVVMAEIQQTSDATFRMFDWNRNDPATGLPRTLHPEQSQRSIRYDFPPGAPVSPVAFEAGAHVRGERLVECPYFTMDRLTCLGGTPATQPGRMEIWLALDGEAVLVGPGYERRFSAGETALVPAAAPACEWRPDPAATLLRTIVPA